MLDKNSPIPLYFQIAERIREQIATGELMAGQQLMPERELGEQMGVSRMTVRQAVNHLLNEGLLDVRAGVGTFVAQPKLTYDALHLLGFTEEMTRRGDHVDSTVLEQSVITPTHRIATHLQIDAAESVVKIVRLRRVNGMPLLLESSFLPVALCPGLETVDLAMTSLYHLLETRFGLPLSHSRQTIEATIANDYEMQLFKITSGSPMILLEGVAMLNNNRPIEYFKAVYRGDRFKFEVESQRTGYYGVNGKAIGVATKLKAAPC